MKTLIAFLSLCLFIAPAYAFTIEEASGEPTMNIEDYIKDFVDVPKGGINWTLFGTTGAIHVTTKSEDGYDNYYSKPDFQPEVKTLDGKEIKIRGYMFPLDESEKQQMFLFGPFPLSCPFHYHIGPALVMEVHAKDHPVMFDYEPITITGTLELVPDDPKYGVFYRLNNTKPEK